MPRLTGFEAIRQIRSFYEGEQVPIIVFSAFVSDESWKAKAILAGANECLLKPNDVYKLKEIVLKYLSSDMDKNRMASKTSAT